MKKSIAMKWVKALRGESEDGVYEQGRGKLVDENDRFCCLGVLCNLHNEFDWYEDDAGNYVYGDKTGCLPYEVQEWAGMGSVYGTVFTPVKGLWCTLARANDEGVTFKEIADHIEEHYTEL